MITPIQNNQHSAALTAAQRPAAPQPATKPQDKPTISAYPDSQLAERSETAAQESRETTEKKNTEALRSLASQENRQFLSNPPQNIVSPQTVANTYLQTK